MKTPSAIKLIYILLLFFVTSHKLSATNTIQYISNVNELTKNSVNCLFSVKLENGIVLHSEDEELIQNVTEYVKNNIDDESLSPSSIAEFVGVSKATLYRMFKEMKPINK